MTGYLIGDDSTMHKVRGKKMAGLGKHYSTTAGTQVVGHSLVQALYVVQGRHCPLAVAVVSAAGGLAWPMASISIVRST